MNIKRRLHAAEVASGYYCPRCGHGLEKGNGTQPIDLRLLSREDLEALRGIVQRAAEKAGTQGSRFGG